MGEAQLILQLETQLEAGVPTKYEDGSVVDVTHYYLFGLHERLAHWTSSCPVFRGRLSLRFNAPLLAALRCCFIPEA